MELLLVRHALPVRQVNTDGPADPANGDFVNSNTLPHQPPQ